jgi:bacillithiol biosynthesis cysteine-adding enzyme BshC
MSEPFSTQPIQLHEENLLFHDYLNHSSKIVRFYEWDYQGNWDSCIEARQQNYRQRSEIHNILMAQNKEFGASGVTLANIRKIALPNTLAVVTGQQAGVFGGPLYTVYKILTAIKLTEALNQKYLGFNFIPVFWMEVGDNDYREINHFNLLNIENKLETLQLPDRPDDHRSVYLRSIPDGIESIHQQLLEICQPTEFRQQLLASMQQIYAKDKTFLTAFAEWLNLFFGNYGLVLFNPTDKRLGGIASPFLKAALTYKQNGPEKIREQSNHLEDSGYQPQIKLLPSQTLLFYQADDGARCRIDWENDRFVIQHPTQPYTVREADFQSQIDEIPERFSPNVALRPVLQDFLLPTVAYIAGPAEISYLGQLKQLYRLMEVKQPQFYPRARLTLVEKKINKLVQKFGFNFPQLFELRNDLVENYIKSHREKSLEGDFSRAENETRRVFAELDAVLREVDPTLKGASQKTFQQFEQGLQKLRRKSDQAFERKLETEISQLNKLQVNLFPDANYQERVLNILFYLNKFGPNFIDQLYQTIPIKNLSHHIVFV